MSEGAILKGPGTRKTHWFTPSERLLGFNFILEFEADKNYIGNKMG
jgi:hypothetical protein